MHEQRTAKTLPSPIRRARGSALRHYRTCESALSEKASIYTSDFYRVYGNWLECAKQNNSTETTPNLESQSLLTLNQLTSSPFTLFTPPRCGRTVYKLSQRSYPISVALDYGLYYLDRKILTYRNCKLSVWDDRKLLNTTLPCLRWDLQFFRTM